jgi:hypothetical protein
MSTGMDIVERLRAEAEFSRRLNMQGFQALDDLCTEAALEALMQAACKAAHTDCAAPDCCEPADEDAETDAYAMMMGPDAY